MPATAPPPAETSPAEAAPVDKSGDRVRDMFAQISGRYDLMNHTLSGGVDVWWRRVTVKTVAPATGGPLAGRPILDACCGTGDLAIAYAKATDAPVVGTDFTHEMLTLAGDKQPSGRRVTYAEADTQRLPFASDTFQIVSVAFGLRNVSDTDAGLRELTRVTAPGGRVAVLEFSRPRGAVMGRVYPLYFKHVLPRVGQFFVRNNRDAYEYLPESVGQFPDGEALCDRMRAAGLREVTHRPMTFGVCTLYVGRK